MAILLVGLGNPGSEYEATRHNIGFRVLECFAKEHGGEIQKKGFSSLWSKVSVPSPDGLKDVFLQLPQTYMNLSGEAVRALADYYRVLPKQVMVVHDELDLPLGKHKKAFGSGAAGHRGVSSVTQHLATKDFWRLRLGIGRPAAVEEAEGSGRKKEMVSDFVLRPFSREEEKLVSIMLREAVSLLNDFILEVS